MHASTAPTAPDAQPVEGHAQQPKEVEQRPADAGAEEGGPLGPASDDAVDIAALEAPVPLESAALLSQPADKAKQGAVGEAPEAALSC